MASQTEIKDLSRDPDADKKRTSSSGRSSAPRTSKSDTELRTRLEACFERIALSLDARGDDELAGIIGEDGPVMAQGLVNLTRMSPFKPVRTVVLVLVSIVEPALAFRRIFQVLGGRFAERRMARAEAQAEAQAEAAAAQAEYHE